MNVIYDKTTGMILNAISDEIDYKVYYIHFGQDFIDNLNVLVIKEIPIDLSNYYVKNNELAEYTVLELEEKRQYGKILTEEERLLMKMKPLQSEVGKAKQTLEMINLINEVIM